MYKFREINKNSEYRLYSNQVFDKENCYVYYKSYMAYADDLNNSTQDKIRKHKDTIDFAIKYVDGQYKAGLKGYSQIVFPQSLNKLYYRTVYQFVRALHRKDREQKHYLGSQPYWVNDKAIIDNGYRIDSDKKFQMFVKFIPSYQSNSKDAPIEPISLNLVADNATKKNWFNLYQDGFDLVYRPEGLGVRFVTEKIVQKKKFNGIEKFILINSDGTIYTATTQLNLPEEEVKKIQKEYATNNELIASFTYSMLNNKTIKTVRKIKAFTSTKKFRKRLEIVKRAVKSSIFCNIDNETKVTVLYNIETDSNILRELNEALVESTEDICKKQGIECNIVPIKSKNLVSALTAFKRKANERTVAKTKRKVFRRVIKHRWDEFLLVLMQMTYIDKFPILLNPERFSAIVQKATSSWNSDLLPDKETNESTDNLCYSTPISQPEIVWI